ncbi:MAG: creatininase family protein [Chloroflexi bacterium CFX4]|nr:creatininase family protein [Chloroflexi bacterium CFX4]MDL1923387.1 creatininase family protein [Chloroflexi bacterium CFX3]
MPKKSSKNGGAEKAAKADAKKSARVPKLSPIPSTANGATARRRTLDLKFPSFCLGDLSYVDVQEYLKHSDTILIPKASLEQHGPHLPLFCDSITALEVAKRAGEAAGILYTPTLWLGYSPQHMRSPGWGAGTITLRENTYLNLIYDIGRSLIHHGFNRLIFVNGHGSNVKVIDPVLRRLRYETGALIAYYKPYAERYIGMLKDVLEGTPEQTPGWHAGELETSQVLAHNAELVRLDRAKTDKAHAPAWLGEAWAKKDGMPDAEFQGYQYFSFPFDHEEFTDSGVMGVPQHGTAEKGEIAFQRFAQHLIDAVYELEKVEVTVHDRDFTVDKAWTPD